MFIVQDSDAQTDSDRHPSGPGIEDPFGDALPQAFSDLASSGQTSFRQYGNELIASVTTDDIYPTELLPAAFGDAL